MHRELAGVIACLQEIEIACDKLDMLNSGRDGHLLGPLQKMIKKFLLDVDLIKAEKIHEHLNQLAESAEAGGALADVFHAKVIVDGHETSLAGLHVELTEVFEDLA